MKGLLFGLGSSWKTFLEPTYVDNQLWFGSTALSFCFKFGHLFGPLLHFFGSSGAIFGIGMRFKNIFGTFLCSQSTLVLKVQPYLFAFTSAKFWALFRPLGAIVWVEVRFKNFFGTYLHRLTTFILEV